MIFSGYGAEQVIVCAWLYGVPLPIIL